MDYRAKVELNDHFKIPTIVVYVTHTKQAYCNSYSLHVGTGWSIRITIRHVDRPTKNLSMKTH